MNFTKLDKCLQDLAQSASPGVGCVVTSGNETVYRGYYGCADIETGRKVDERTAYRIFSMTKVPVYALCLMLYERGCFSLEDPVSQFFPEFEKLSTCNRNPDGTCSVLPEDEPVRIKHILTMTMGIPYGSHPDSDDPGEAAMYTMHQQLLKKGYYTLWE